MIAHDPETMKWEYSFYLSFFLAGSLMATTATTTLTLVENEGDFGLIDVTVSPPVGSSSSDTTTLTGNLSLELDIDTISDTVSSLTVNNSEIIGSQLSFSASSLAVSYNATSSAMIGIDVLTTTPPGKVDPSTGNYDASEHPFLINQGTLTGYADILLAGRSDINVNFADTPFGSANTGTGGNIALSLIGTSSTAKTYSVELIYPVSTLATLPVGSISVDVEIVGTVKAVGTIEVPLPNPFTTWLAENDLAGATFEEDSNQDGLANGLQWALGLAANESPLPYMLTFALSTPTSVSYTLDLPAGGTAGDLTIQHTSSLTSAFTPLASGAVSAGNPIPAGTSGMVTITLPAGDQGFLQVSAEAP